MYLYCYPICRCTNAYYNLLLFCFFLYIFIPVLCLLFVNYFFFTNPTQGLTLFVSMLWKI
jgi:hypothetical protein